MRGGGGWLGIIKVNQKTPWAKNLWTINMK